MASICIELLFWGCQKKHNQKVFGEKRKFKKKKWKRERKLQSSQITINYVYNNYTVPDGYTADMQEDQLLQGNLCAHLIFAFPLEQGSQLMLGYLHPQWAGEDNEGEWFHPLSGKACSHEWVPAQLASLPSSPRPHFSAMFCWPIPLTLPSMKEAGC